MIELCVTGGVIINSGGVSRMHSRAADPVWNVDEMKLVRSVTFFKQSAHP
jgi:hypothetical protein